MFVVGDLDRSRGHGAGRRGAWVLSGGSGQKMCVDMPGAWGVRLRLEGSVQLHRPVAAVVLQESTQLAPDPNHQHLT